MTAITPVPGTKVTLKLPACMDCKYFRETQVFLLCDHAESKYSIAGKDDQHTVGHMRLHTCGGDARFFEPRP